MSKDVAAWRRVIWYVPLVVSGLVASHLAAVTIYHMEFLGVSCTYLYVIAGAAAVFGGLSYLMRRRRILKLWVILLVVVGGFALFPDQGAVVSPICIPGEYTMPNLMLDTAGSTSLAPDASARW